MRNAALITGGAKRIGKEIALLLSALGYDIALHYNHSANEARQSAKQIQSNGVCCEIFKCDLKNEKSVSSLIPAVKKKFPDFNLLINSASIFEKSSLYNETNSIFDTHLAINLKAPYILSREFARICKKGQIINFLDTNISKNKTAYNAYLLSKKSLAEFTKLAAVEFAPNIRVNAIAPGLILPPKRKNTDYLERLARHIPLKRRGHPNQIALTVQFLIENDFVTGQTIFVDGGEHLL